MHQTSSSGNPETLFRASDSELMALLGLQALPLVKQPEEVLAMGRSGELYGNPEQLGEGEFEHGGLAQVGKIFLRTWAVELQRAICTKGALYKKLREKGSHQTDVLVAVAIGGLSSAIPALAPFSGLITVLSVLLVKTGVDAFCQMLSDKGSPLLK